MTTFGASYKKNEDKKTASFQGGTKSSSSSKTPSLREFYATTLSKMKDDPTNRATYEQALNTVTTDPNSPWYNPYSQATSNKVNESNVVRTQKALSELDDINNQIKYWVGRTDRNYSDDEIVSMIDLSKYSTLKTLESDRQKGFPSDLLAPVDYSEDALYGMVWSARNGGQTTGNYAVDAAMSYMGKGNLSPQSTRAHMADATLETYAPYKAGRSVTTDKYAYQFGATADFDDSWLLAHNYLKNTEEGSKIYNDIHTANENTKKYEASVAAFNKFVESQIKVGADPSQFLNPDNLAVHDWGKDILKLVEGQNSGKLVETTRPLDFDWGDVQRRAKEAFEREEAKVPAEKFEEDVATALKADEPVKKPDNFFKNTAKKTRDWVVGLFADEATEEETVALKADDGSFDDVKESVTHSIETSTATTDDMYDIALNEADYYAVKNLLPARHRQKELEEEIAGYKAVGEFIAKWEKKLEDGSANPADIYSDPEYIADFQAVEKYYDAYEENGGDVSVLETELEEQKATQAEVMRRYDAAAQYQGYDSGSSALPYLDFADQFYGMTDETLAVPSYQWQDALASGEAKWEDVTTKLDDVVKQYNGLIQNINTAIEIGEAGGLDQSVIDGMQAYKRALKKEQEAIKFAQLRNNPDFEAKVSEFDKTIQPYEAKWFSSPTTEDIITTTIIDPVKALAEFGERGIDVLAGQLTEDERQIYKYLYMTEGQERALAYYESLKPSLNMRGYQAMAGEAKIDGAGSFIGKNLMSVMVNAGSVFALAHNVVESAKGNEIDPYSAGNWLTAYSSNVRANSKQAIENNEFLQTHPLLQDIAGLGYDAVMTTADSTAAAATGGGLFLMAASAAQSTLIDAKLRGASDAQAFLLAGCSAAVETATEFLPMAEMLGTFEKAGTMGVKDLIEKIIRGTLEEAPGEMISELVGGISDDLIMQEMAASELRIKQLMEEEGLNPQEAKARAMHEAATDILYAGLLSFGTSFGSQTVAYGAGKIFNVGDYARSNPEVEGVDAGEVATSTSSPASNAAPQKNTTPSAPVTTTTKTVATPQEKAAVVQRDNKILSGQYTLDKNGQPVAKQPRRQLTENEKAAIALKESVKNYSASSASASFSASLQIFGKLDSVTSDAVSKAFVDKFGEDALHELERIVGAGENRFSGKEIVAFMVNAVNSKSSGASVFVSQKERSPGSDYGLDAAMKEASSEVTGEEIKSFVKKYAVAGATVDILKKTDTSRLDSLREAHRAANSALEKANNAYRAAGQELTALRSKEMKAVEDLKRDPQNEKAKNAVIEARKKSEALSAKYKELEAEWIKASREYKEADEKFSSEKQQLIVAARAEATQLVDNYLAEQAASEEAAALQAEADALAQQEADNLSEMEFQSYVEETAPDATPEQVEEMRQEFGEQREAVEQIRAEQVAKEEANGNVQTPEQKTEAKAIENAKAIGKRFKTNVKAMALPSNIDGWFDRDENELVLNSNLSQEQMLEETVVHEFSHKAEDGGRAYDSYSQALLDLAYGGDRKKIKAEIQKVKGKRNKELAQMSQTGGKETYGKDLRFIDDDGARKELVAQATKELLKGDPNLIDSFVNADIDAAYSFFDRLKFVLKRMVGIKGTYAEQLKHTTYLFQKALAKAAENGAKTTKQRVAESKHPASVQFSIDQWAKATGFKFERSPDNKSGYVILDQDGNKIDKVTKEMMDNTPAGKLVDTALNKGSMTAAEADSAKQFLADVMNMVVEFEDQETVWELVGSALFSSVKNNSDKQYGRTVDYGTICSKTRDIVNVMSETMLEKGRGLTREEVIMAYNKTFGEGMSVPCPPCYVFSRWMGVPSLLETMRRGQERFANATDADVNEYINGVKERYAGELAKTKKNGEAKTLAEVMGTRKTNILNKLDVIRQEVASERFNESSLDKVREQQKALEAELEDIELYNWVTQVLCETDSKGKPIEKNGKVSIDKKFKAVPNEVLLDMRKTGEFASGYAKAWRFRTTRGAGMGKAQLPYAGAEVGDVLTGAKRWKANENPFYTGDDAKAKRALANAAKRTKAQNLIGGNRFQSTSDFRPEWGLDYLMTFFEMQAIGAKGQLYTKVIEAVDLFASAGVEVNLSVMAKGDGWHLDENGNPVITLEDFSPVTGIDAEQAMQKSQEYDNVQLILVGMNDTHIELALADDRISFVIPWHSSGNSKEVLGQMMEAVGEKRGKAQDYSDFQTDKIGNQTPEQKAAWDLRKKILTGGFFVKGKAVEPTEAEMATIAGNDYLLDLYNKMYVDETSDSYHVKLSAAQASQIFPHEYWDTNSTYDTADVNGKRFVEYCESMGIEPRFPQFVDNKGYWKLLIDRRMYGRDGNYRPAGYISTSNIKVNALPQSVSQAKPGTNEQIQNAKQKLIDEIDARTAEQHKFDLSAEHAAPAPAIPANVQFSLRDDSSSDWDVDASVEDNIANTARAKELDEEISRLQAEYKAAEKKYNKATKGMSVERFRELRASGDPIITEFTKAQEAYESAKSKREWLVRNVPKDVRDAAKKYLGLKKRYDQTMEYYKEKPQSSLREEAENIAKDMAVAKREYEELLNPYLEKRKENEAKRLERDAVNAPQMPVETEVVEEQASPEDVSYEEASERIKEASDTLVEAGERYSRGEITAEEYVNISMSVSKETTELDQVVMDKKPAEESAPAEPAVALPSQPSVVKEEKTSNLAPAQKAKPVETTQQAAHAAPSPKAASSFQWDKHKDPSLILAELPEFKGIADKNERIKAARSAVPPELYRAYVEAKFVTKTARESGKGYHVDPKERQAWAKYEALVDKYNAKLADGERASISEGKPFSVVDFLGKQRTEDASEAFNNSVQELRRGYDNQPSGIYADPKAGDDSDYGAEDEPVKPTNEFTYGALDPAFKIPEAPKGKRVHDTSRKIVADESLPDAVRLEEAKPENSQYEQDSNEAQHNRAAEIIRRRGIDNEYERLMKLDSASSPDDVAELLILEQIYNREGTRDMEKLLGVTKKKRQLSAVAATILQSTKSEIAKMSPTELVSRFLGESEDSLENFIKDRPKTAEKIKERADAKTEALSAAVAGKSLDEVSEDNKWYTPLNEAQMAVIKEYGLENVERAGIFYNRATVKQRMLEAIIQTKDPFAMTGMGMNLIERLEYIRSGAQAITIADLNYIQRNLGEFSFFDGLQGGRVSDLALNRAYEAYGNTKTASFFEKFRSMRYINMLTSFTSAFKNIIGNASMIAVENVSHEVENVVDLGISLFTGKREKQSLTLQERLAGWEAFKDECVNTFRDYFVDKVDTNPKNDPFNTHRKGRVYQNKANEGARNLQGFLMSFGDRNFWKRAYVNSLSEQQKLLDKGLLLNEDGSVPTMDQMIERAKGEADYAVLSEDNFVSKTFRRLAVEHPVAAEMISYYMPFTGVPTNVIKRGVEYSPLNAVATVGEALWRGFRGKKFNQKKFVEGVCRPLTTAGVYMLGSMLYNAGKIKMGTGDDEDEGTKYYDARTALGDQYSAYLVDDSSGTNASLSSLGTVGTMLLFGAAMSSELDKQGEDGKRLMVAVWNALNHSIDSIVDASYLSGITDFFNSNLDESFLETGVRLFGENVAGQMVGAPVAQFAEYLDPYVRDTKDKNKIIEIYKSVANKIPYLRETLPKKVYVTGTVAETRRPPVTKFVDPFTRSHQYEEPELEEAMRLYEFAKNSSDPDIAGNAKSVLPEDVLRNKKTSFKYNGAEYELNDQQKEAYKLKYGEIWTAKVAARMNDRGWAAYDDETKFKLIKSDMSKAKAETMEWAIANLIDY